MQSVVNVNCRLIDNISSLHINNTFISIDDYCFYDVVGQERPTY